MGTIIKRLQKESQKYSLQDYIEMIAVKANQADVDNQMKLKTNKADTQEIIK